MNYSNNFISNSLFKIKKYMYAHIEFNKILDKDYIKDYIKDIVTKNSILQSYYFEENKKFYIKKIDNFDPKNNYKIIYTSFKNKNKYLYEIINTPLKTQTKWMVYFLIDIKKKESLMYFKIEHSYCDGYNFIKILLSHYNNKDLITPKFKRITHDYFSMVYYYLIGTIILFISLIKYIYNFYKFINKTKNKNKNKTENVKTDYIFYNGFDLNEIKLFTSKNNITINDFLFALMIKTDYIYNGIEKNLKITIPINTNNKNNTNNILPLFIEINNSYENNILLKNIHKNFNNYKYSLFIPILSYLINIFSDIIPIDIDIFNYLTNYTNYNFTNIIFPSSDCSIINDNNLKNINCLTNINGNETTFNIISFKNKINIVITFKKGNIDKKKFKDALYKAYNSIINT